MVYLSWSVVDSGPGIQHFSRPTFGLIFNFYFSSIRVEESTAQLQSYVISDSVNCQSFAELRYHTVLMSYLLSPESSDLHETRFAVFGRFSGCESRTVELSPVYSKYTSDFRNAEASFRSKMRSLICNQMAPRAQAGVKDKHTKFNALEYESTAGLRAVPGGKQASSAEGPAIWAKAQT
ncbi:hypothetical protein E4U40_000505 [Claviceps sp. LM458 group G5]|nr:hypothetical protein E4U40_000505 [Claviceps sp. LM458 group G5]